MYKETDKVPKNGHFIFNKLFVIIESAKKIASMDWLYDSFSKLGVLPPRSTTVL